MSIIKKDKSLHLDLARKIVDDIYWPLTELDIFDEMSDKQQKRKRFVCSESKTIFNNLSNQTFTVINSLQLSQYNDFVQQESSSLPMKDIHHNHRSRTGRMPGGNFNLYACIVDADVRHNYATLGVHFRPNPIPIDLSKRLRARSAVVTKQRQQNSLLLSNKLESSLNDNNNNSTKSIESTKQPIEPFEVVLTNEQRQQTITNLYNQNYDLFRESPLECK